MSVDLAEVFSKKMTKAEVKASVRSLRLIEAMKRGERPPELAYPKIECPDCDSDIEPEVQASGEVSYQCRGVTECAECGHEKDCCYEETYPSCFGLPGSPLCVLVKSYGHCVDRPACVGNQIDPKLTALTGRLGPGG